VRAVGGEELAGSLEEAIAGGRCCVGHRSSRVQDGGWAAGIRFGRDDSIFPEDTAE
jgi:hypothetical protein